MKIKIIISIFLLPFLLSAQDDNRGQSIELPDFVITGVQTVNIPTAKKVKPQLISMLSEEFITPQFSPEMFALSGISEPVLPNLDLAEEKDAVNGQVKVGAGLYTLPQGELNLGAGFKHASIFGRVFGLNEREYIDNAGYNISGGALYTDFFVSNRSKFLPGLNLFVNINYLRDSYKFFGSDSSGLEHRTQTADIAFGLKNNYNKNFKYGISFNSSFFDIRDRDFGESKFHTNAFIDMMVSSFGIQGDADFISQHLTNNISGKTNYNYFSTDSRAVLRINSAMQAKAGINLAIYDGNSFFAPTGSISIKLNEALTFFGEYAPGTNFISISDFKRRNRYSIVDSTDNIVQKEKHKFNAALRYQFLRYVEISAGASYSKFDNYVYFQDSTFNGLFNSSSIDDVNKISIYANLMFHMGPLGYFYADAAWQNVEDSGNNQIPYNHNFTAELIYGYNFENGFSFSTKADFRSAAYADIQNKIEVPDYFNLSLMMEYKLSNHLRFTFDLHNLINRKNFLWSDYREKKFDFVAGVDYRW
ncbi:MAG: hypothetical protein HND52_02270 [Ignavibacteriae bacterium]|nr:hypothetical protein [Ignavibacteriota bacterium]NOG96775.1 hypothetical protein [Ignavibacteriota bacterium]